MKKRVNITISDEALSIADESGNRSEYIESLLLGFQERKLEVIPFNQLKVALDEILEAIKERPRPEPALDPVGDLLKATEFVPKAPDPITGYPCCEGLSPCKHWVWDDSVPCWKNSLTGATRNE